MRPALVLYAILILLSVLVMNESKSDASVREEFREYMTGETTPPPKPAEEEAQVNPPKVWRRKREIDPNPNSVENLVLDADDAKDFAGRIDGDVQEKL